MSIDDFPLSWRWTQPSHAVLPQNVMESLSIMEKQQASHFYAFGERIFKQHVASAITHKTSDTTRTWLGTLNIPVTAQVVIAWNKLDALSLPWPTFIEYWEDFCYPGSDDAFLFPAGCASVLAWHHHETFEFIENVS